MKKLYTKIRTLALNSLKRDNLFSACVKFLFLFFSNGYVRTVIAILETVVIGIMTSKNYYGVWFYIAVISYCISLFLITSSEQYMREKLTETKHMKEGLLGISILLRKWSISLQKSAKKLSKNEVKTNVEAVKIILSNTDFQNAAFSVCEILRERLSKYYDIDNIYITVFQKQIDSKKSTCQMIAYSGTQQPSSFGQTYNIPDKSHAFLGEIEYHSYIFAHDKSEISVLPDRKSVQKAFCPHAQCAEREQQIQQYVGIPIVIPNYGVTFILQIDTDIKNLFGIDTTSVTKFAKSVVYPYAQFLHMIYEEERTIKQLANR